MVNFAGKTTILSAFQKKLLFFVFGLLILSYLMSIPDRKPHLDDAWLSEHSYWLLNHGVAQTKLMTGIADGENRLVLHHKLFTLQGAAVIFLFGYSLQWLKSVGLLYLLLTVLLIYANRRHKKLFYNEFAAFLCVLLLWLHPLVFEFSFVFRPETMLMFFGLVSFLLLQRSADQDDSRMPAWLSGLVAGIAFATHLNGSVAIAAGFLFLVFRRQFKLAALFALGAITTATIYFYDFGGLSDFGLWYRQLTFIPSGDDQSNGIFWKFLMNIFNEHERYFHSPKEIVFTLLILLSLVFLWKKQRHNYPVLLQYTFWLVLSMSIIALNKTSKYLILLLPYFSMILSNVLTDSELMRKKTLRISLISLLAIFILTSFIYNFITATEKYDPQLNRNITAKLAGAQARNMTVMAPMMFVFDEMSQYQKIISLMSINERLKIDSTLKSVGLLDKLSGEGIDMLLLNDHYIDKLDFGDFAPGDQVHGFELIYKQPDLMAWRKFAPDLIKTDEKLPTDQHIGIFYYGSAFSY